jgi:distribution and morphology protein 31
VNVDHLQGATSTRVGPISWITSGKFDAVLDIKFPRDQSSEVDISSLLNEIARNISGDSSENPFSKFSSLSDRIPGQRELAKPALRPPGSAILGDGFVKEELGLDVVVDIDLRFRDVKAAVPIFTSGLSYTNSALVRPIVAFIK